MFEQLKPIEDGLGKLFKGLPSLPDNIKKFLIKVWPWLALIGGILQLLGAWSLWHNGHKVNETVKILNDYYSAWTGESVASELGVAYWLAFIFVIVSAVVLLAAYPGLKDRKKSGWDWIFLGALINVVYAIILLFVDDYHGGGAGSFIGSLIGSAIGFYLLFQIREYYNGKKVEANVADKTTEDKPESVEN